MSKGKQPVDSEENGELEKFRCLRHNGSLYHDIFLSYRVNTEKKLADKLALLLDQYPKANGGGNIRTFLDSNCLLDGGDWEKNFMSALHRSTLIVLLISEAGLDLASPSGHGTKIQYADHEQDNCLLEYEYAMRLKDQHKADVLLMCVGKEGVLNDVRCKIKFPYTPENIERRLAMYSDTGPHNHRDGTKGPRVPETMRKLLGMIKPPKKGKLPSFVHIDPDDAASRIPDILRKFAAAESKFDFKKISRRWIEDIAYMKSKFMGIFFGVIFPLFSLLFLLTVRSARHEAIRFGLLIGHGMTTFGFSIYTFYQAYRELPEGCDNFSVCLVNAQYLARSHLKWLADCSSKFAGGCSDFDAGLSVDCRTCFCETYAQYCDNLDSGQQASLFISVSFLLICAGFFISAKYFLGVSEKRRFKSMYV